MSAARYVDCCACMSAAPMMKSGRLPVWMLVPSVIVRLLVSVF
jgi:hypothetical protein